MLHNRLFNSVVAATLLALAAITLYQVVATTQVVEAASEYRVSASQPGDTAEAPACTFSAVDRRSLRAVYVKEMGGWLPRTDSGFTGFDSGLLALRDC